MERRNIRRLFLVSFIVVLFTLFIYSASIWKSDQNLQQDTSGYTMKATYSSKEPIEIDFPSWISTKTEDMSAKDVFEYFEWSNHSSCQLINDFGGRFMDGTLKGHRFYDGQKA